MFDKFSELADKHNIYGWKRAVYFAISPIIYGIAWIYGWVKGYVMAITGKL